MSDFSIGTGPLYDDRSVVPHAKNLGEYASGLRPGLWELFFKRGVDVVVATLALVALSPLMIMVAGALCLSGGRVLFAQERLGRGGKTFRIYKFRTMATDAEARLKAILAQDAEARATYERCYKLEPDPRITPLGRVLRASNADELPQLVNILLGDMSVVGPRPRTLAELSDPEAGTARFARYYDVRPGLTGLWQVSGRHRLAYSERLALDARYADTMSWRTDLTLILKTIPRLFDRSGTS
jgi:exopolysaccharide production protein ExoY